MATPATGHPVKYRDPETKQWRDALLRERVLHRDGLYGHLSVRGDRPGADLELALPEQDIRYLDGVDYTNVRAR